ncbi:hypothetical protein DWB77_07450 [Streptomyces hundungensis]|uniref:Uncharacterized protein n=1 Tax=Streptomyces hundungensis TaxID=1077946 RepID=A0A387HQW8_9ACTN|nr:helix-turn-helix domain-containing protein [Streptomyces hundungensis]AYG85233.1 hypothetical protein DWB77_07450 [Streptomyces hundungensis]
MDFKIPVSRGPRGGGRLLREREVYLQLTQQGYSNREAGRIVGIHSRTGKRWRNGWHSPPTGKPKPPITVEALASEPSRYLREAHPHRRPAAGECVRPAGRLARVQSSRAKDYVGEFNAALAPWRREPAVREFVQRARRELGVAA